METTDNDFKLMLKRIGVTTLLFVVAFGVHMAYKASPKVLLTPETVTVKDTVMVSSKDALQSEIFISYQVKIDPALINEQDRDAYQRSSDKFVRNHLLFPMREKLRTDVFNYVMFNHPDSVDVTIKVLHETVDQAIESLYQKNIKYFAGSGMEVSNTSYDIKFEPLITMLIANYKAKEATERLNRIKSFTPTSRSLKVSKMGSSYIIHH